MSGSGEEDDAGGAHHTNPLVVKHSVTGKSVSLSQEDYDSLVSGKPSDALKESLISLRNPL